MGTLLENFKKKCSWLNICFLYNSGSEMSNLYSWFPSYSEPTFHKVVTVWSGYSDHCAERPARAEQLSSELSVVCWLSLRTHVRRALRGYWVISVPHKWTRGPLSFPRDNIYNLAADIFIREVHKIGCNWSVTWKLQLVTCFKQHVWLYVCDPTVFKVG